MTATEAIDYIEAYTWSTTRLGLGRTRTLLHATGDPQKSLKFVHVAGSNGKGSTCAMLDAVLRASGYRTGLYTSPYIQDFCERIRVNGENIPGDDLARITDEVRTIADSMDDHPSQFELVTAIAMQFFKEQQCDLVVLEVGMGGALDSTNVIDAPEVAVITNIGLEHTEYLGNTLVEIATAKGGIIKSGCTVVLYDSTPEVLGTIQEICHTQGCPLHVSRAADVTGLSHSLDGQRFVWKGSEYHLSLLGAHQLRNAAVLLETVSALRKRGWSIPEDAVRQGLTTVRWPARFEVLSKDPLFILDGGHNPQCAEALAGALSAELPGTRFSVLLGVLADKDYEQMLNCIAPFAEAFFCVTPDSPRALPAEQLCKVLHSHGLRAHAFPSVEDGIRAALQAGRPVVAFGSLYLAGHVRTAFPRQLKRFQRTLALTRRDGLPSDSRAEKSARISWELLSSPCYREAHTIFLFCAFRSEVDLSAFARQAKQDGKTLCYPACGEQFTMRALEPHGTWYTDRYGIRSPDPEASRVVPPEEIDLILCPCSAFDDAGHRLGMGAGYYDRFLPLCHNARKILVAFEVQRLPEVCIESCDVPMNGIVTEAGLRFL